MSTLPIRPLRRPSRPPSPTDQPARRTRRRARRSKRPSRSSIEGELARRRALAQREWVTHAWVKQAILLYFAHPRDAEHRGRALRVPRQDPAQEEPRRGRRARRAAGHRALRRVPRAGRHRDAGLRQHRRARRRGTMVDTWATVGSCAQIGRDCHLAGGVGIGGVLEPPGARPVIIEDGVFVGSRAVIVEGLLVEREAVIGAGVVLTVVDRDPRRNGRRAGRAPRPRPGAQRGHPRHRARRSFPAGEFGSPARSSSASAARAPTARSRSTRRCATSPSPCDAMNA